MALPGLLFGGGTVGTSQLDTTHEVANLLQTLQQLEISRLDAALVCSSTNPGKCEQLLGVIGALQLGFRVSTKIKVIGEAPGKGSLTKNAIDPCIAESLTRPKTDQVSFLKTNRHQTPNGLYMRRRYALVGLIDILCHW